MLKWRMRLLQWRADPHLIHMLTDAAFNLILLMTASIT
uniref:Uncharacterized protein n=1 Tax=Arundo donax TaxID=35708 RepID=A0A0A9H408_ARUDO